MNKSPLDPTLEKRARDLLRAQYIKQQIRDSDALLQGMPWVNLSIGVQASLTVIVELLSEPDRAAAIARPDLVDYRYEK